MPRRKPLGLGSPGLTEQPVATWAKAVAVAVGGAVSVTIPAGIFTALPVLRHTIQATGTRDYVFRCSGLVLNADKSVMVTGVIRESRTMPAVIATLGALAGFDTFQAATTAVTLHLSAEDSD
ncbi:hypothetical protein MKK75_27115 [Methylobacterium sp. J-030]|uniref:hypothetical protein n=1 Tax=Methylobacterium sp. J-030 TaxID=2836627 RepID=UPI001FB8B314|nr:hypothetical protein [Methylobacterium sp. J-030]MCJ2072419.1 hypothetical protein [Methylobacterium sp. J-030]